MGDSARIDRVGVVGAGFMGSGIAEATARAGASVVLYEPGQAAADPSAGPARSLAGGPLRAGTGGAGPVARPARSLAGARGARRQARRDGGHGPPWPRELVD